MSSNPYPRNPQEQKLLTEATTRLLGTIPDTWQPFNEDSLSSVDQRALALLTFAGLVERRNTLRFISMVHKFTADAEVVFTGAEGSREALQVASAELWKEAETTDAYKSWAQSDLKNCSPFRCERLLSDRRLTDNGIAAREDLTDPALRDMVVEIVLRVGRGSDLKMIPGYGRLLNMTRNSDGNFTQVTAVGLESDSNKTPRKYITRDEAERIAKEKFSMLWRIDNQSEWARVIGCDRAQVKMLPSWTEAEKRRDNWAHVKEKLAVYVDPSVIDALHAGDASLLSSLAEEYREQIDAMPDADRATLLRMVRESAADT